MTRAIHCLTSCKSSAPRLFGMTASPGSASQRRLVLVRPFRYDAPICTLETHDMLIGAVLLLTWLILLLRYPSKALPVSLAAAVGLGMVAAFVVWQDSRDAQRLERLHLRLDYAPQQCPTGRPLLVLIDNGNKVALTELRWKIAAYAPGDTVNLAEDTYTAPRYRGPGELLPASQWQDCLPLPPLRPGYRPQTLEFRAERLQGSFSG